MATFASSSIRPIEQRKAHQGFDGWLLLATGILILVGLMSIYSIGAGRGGLRYFYQQLVYTAVGIVPFSIFAFVKPRFWARISTQLYIVNVVALLAVLLRGHSAKGAERWIEIGHYQFQPSEMAKIITILTLATFLTKRQETIESRQTCIQSVLHVAVPALLILLQPHLGATVVLIVAWMAMTIVADVPWRTVGATALIVLCLGGVALSIPSVQDRLLHGYMEKRLKGFSSGSKDSKDKNFQTEQAKYAFATGGSFGSGYLKGAQKQGGFIPEQHNDFIFTVPGEEAGFIGCTLILAAYAFFFYRVWLIMLRARDPYHKMIVAGIYAVLGFHMFVNLAMVLQLVPVVGLWLPFMSYGGTAMWLCLSCVGLLLNIDRRERPVIF